jgi:puromycin-sensitive aminopeptidase
VEQVFDAISYCKGGSVVRMICAVLGKKAFQEGLAAYMSQHKYGNTETYDLWNAWEKSSGMPVGELMKSWTEQMGFPMITVKKETWNANSVELELEQQWFLSDGCELSSDEATKKWTIPILTCTPDGIQSDMTLMREQVCTVTVPITSPDAWVKLNAGQEVPLCILYTQGMLKRLADGIKSKTLPPCDRAALLTDSYAFVKAGRMPPEVLIELISSYENEDSYIVWQGLAAVLEGLDAVMSDDKAISINFTKFARNIVLGLLPRVGWEPSEPETVAAEANQRFAKFLENANDVVSLPSDMRTSVFRIVLKNGGEAEYDQVLNYFHTASDNAERKHVLSSLGYTKSPALKLRTLEWTTSGAVKLQDFFYAMGSVGRSSNEGREISWRFFQDNFEKIRGMIGKGSPSLMDACIVSCAGAFCSAEKADEIDAFFKIHPVPGSARKIAQTTENMRTNAKFLEMLQASPLSKNDFWDEL